MNLDTATATTAAVINAVEPVSAGDYVAELQREAMAHCAVNHPYLEALSAGSLPDPAAAIRDLTYQYMAYTSNFPRYLTSTISHLENPLHRRVLLANLAEENGSVSEDEAEELARAGIMIEWIDRVPHTQLYRRFLAAVGMDEAWLAAHRHCDEAVVWSNLFLQTCQEGAAQAVGALGLGTESIVRYVYAPVLQAIKRYLDIAPVDRVFFDLHCTVDDAHGASLLQVATDLARDASQRRALRLGMLMALNLRVFFYDHMWRRARHLEHGARS